MVFTPPCRAEIDSFYAEYVVGPGVSTDDFLKKNVTMHARNLAEFYSDMIMEKISSHRTAIRNLDRTISNAQHIATRQHVSTQRIGSQIPTMPDITELEIAIKTVTYIVGASSCYTM